MDKETLMWIVFGAVVVALLVLDLGVFQRKSHAIDIKEALGWSAFWIGLAMLFNAGVWYELGPQSATEFFTGWLLEKSLSVDNLFVFLLVFGYFKVPREYQHKVLFWGIVGALLMRAVFIGAGIAIIRQFEWVIYVFGVFLVYTGFKLAFGGDDDEVDPGHSPVVKLARRLIPVSDQYDGGKFFTRIGGKLHATPLFIVLLVIETTDVVFAVDSIPTILSITQHPFTVYSSNVFAILGLRALYFALSALADLFHYLKIGLAVILTFVGVKMLIHHYYDMPTSVALGFIAAVLFLSITASKIWPKTEKGEVGPEVEVDAGKR